MRISRLLAPEVIQTSSMDCGPASLKALLAYFDIHISYDRLREACQTDVDGTSIDVLEELANDLGVEASQCMLPVDALLDTVSELSPSLLVLFLGEGLGLHFVVMWSKWGKRFQLMDPSQGRRWVDGDLLQQKIYRHRQTLHGEDWLEIMSRGPFLPWLTQKIARLGAGEGARRVVDQAINQNGWRGLCALDAAVRMVGWLLSSRHITPGAQATRLLSHCIDLGHQEMETGQKMIPPEYWFARPRRPNKPALIMEGAVLLVPTRRQQARDLSPRQRELVTLLRQEPKPLLSELRDLVRPQDAPTLMTLGGALVLGSFGALAEMMIFRASSSLVQRLGVLHQRFAALAAFGVFLLVLLLIDLAIVSSSQQLGRQIEVHLRLLLLGKLPTLSDGYFRSRVMSDMALRAHALHNLRGLPSMLQGLFSAAVNLVVTIGAISLFHPQLAGVACIGALLSMVVPLIAMRWVYELETRLQDQQGALSKFYLDALAGLVPIRTHGAEQSLAREQQRKLAEWFESASARQQAVTLLSTTQGLFAATLSVALVYAYVRGNPDPQGLLLLLFWTQRIPSLGQSITHSLASLAPMRTTFARLLEPLRSPSEALPESRAAHDDRLTPRGVHLHFVGVSVVAGGQQILQELDLQIKAGEQVAIVGRSGAGKSSLLSLLLGIHKPSAGQIFVDGEPVEGKELFARLSHDLCWVDPAIQLWNDSLLSNLQFGSQDLPQRPISYVVEQADLIEVLDRLPEGFQTRLGDGGALVSGGEGQRVRLGRALLRRNIRLALLDEPFRGLDRHKRRHLLARVRALLPDATLLCVTHDVAETREFDRILVVQDGKVVEDGSPTALLASQTRYRQLLESDQQAAANVWAVGQWRRVRVDGGRVVDVETTVKP